MDRINKKTEDKKTVKDRGDLKRILASKESDKIRIKDCKADRGDSEVKTRESTRNSDKLVTNTVTPKLSLNGKKISEPTVKKNQSSKRNSNEHNSDSKFESNPKTGERNQFEDEEKAIRKEAKSDNHSDLVSPIKAKPNVKKIDESKWKPLNPKKDDKVVVRSEIQNKAYLDLEARKRLREKYTVKLKSSINCENKMDNSKGSFKADDHDKKTDDGTDKMKSNDSFKGSIFSEITKSSKFKRPKQPTNAKRKPIIQTIKFNDDTRVYKAVTFIERTKATPIQIKIPSDYKKSLNSEPASNILRNKAKAVSKESVPVKPVKKKEKKRQANQRTPSPEMLKLKEGSPPTEVAKWAPSCFNRHTMPYYEAWVDTTLAAITKCSENDKLYLEKQSIIQSFKRALEMRSASPDLVYDNFNDERYTGKITVRRR